MNKRRKLTLNRETLRHLGAVHLRRIRGAGESYAVDCPSGSCPVDCASVGCPGGTGTCGCPSMPELYLSQCNPC